MAKERVVETEAEIQLEFDTTDYEQMMRRMRDKGWLATGAILKAGIDEGLVLEVGPGPGYLGLEWLKKTKGTTLCGLDISIDMIELARGNALGYGLADRVEYVAGDAQEMVFDKAAFDAVFSSASLHEWPDALKVLNEIHRVLKPGGKLFISDLRRDISRYARWFLLAVTKPKEIRPGLIVSLDAAYTISELEELLQQSALQDMRVEKNFLGLTVKGPA